MSNNLIINILPIRFIPFDIGIPIRKYRRSIEQYLAQQKQVRLTTPAGVERLITPDIAFQFQTWPHPLKENVKMVLNLFEDGHGIITLFDEIVRYKLNNNFQSLWKQQLDIHESLFSFTHEIYSPVLQQQIEGLRNLCSGIAQRNRIPIRESGNKRWETNGLRYINTVLFIQHNNKSTQSPLVKQITASQYLNNMQIDFDSSYCRITAWESAIIIGAYDDDFAKHLHLHRKLERARFYIYSLRKQLEQEICLINNQKIFSNTDVASTHDFHLQTKLKVAELKEIGAHRLLASKYYELFQPLLKANRIPQEIDRLEELLRLIEEHLLVHVKQTETGFQRASTLALLVIAAFQVVGIAIQQNSVSNNTIFALFMAILMAILIAGRVLQFLVQYFKSKIIKQRRIKSI